MMNRAQIDSGRPQRLSTWLPLSSASTATHLLHLLSNSFDPVLVSSYLGLPHSNVGQRLKVLEFRSDSGFHSSQLELRRQHAEI